MRASGRSLAALVVLASSACGACFGTPAMLAGCKHDSTASSAAPPPAALEPDASVAPDSARAAKMLWRDALAAPDDSVELARLADAEGAAGLLEGLEEGGAVGLVALAALPYADDAEIALGRLGEIVAQVEPGAMAPVLDSIEGIVQRPLRPTEPLLPTGAHVAFDALLAVAKRTELPAPTRARAVSVARLIADRGPYDAKLLPTEFDK